MEHATLDRAVGIEDEPEIPAVPPGEDELPNSDGVPMESQRHLLQMTLLIMSLRDAWKDRHDFYVSGNMFVYYSEHQIKRNDFRGPDVFVVLDTSDRERKSWVSWGEGGKLPDVVIELLSDRTRHIDRGEKMHIYSRLWKVAQCYLYDPFSYEFEGYQLNEDRSFVPIAANPNGDLVCPRLGLRLGIRAGRFQGIEAPWLRWIDASGQPLLLASEQALQALARTELERERLEAEFARAIEAERLRADEAERKLRELEAELRAKPRD